MLVTADFFDDLMIRHFRFDQNLRFDDARGVYETLQRRRDEALVGAAKHLITMLESASERADALAYELQDYVERIEEKSKPEPKAKRKAKKDV